MSSFTTRIPEQTLASYRTAEYAVFTEPAFVLKVDEPSAALAALHERAGVRESAFITACNPESAPLDEATNAARQAELARLLAAKGYAWIAAEGRSPARNWVEPSYLVLGLGLEEGAALGRRFAQNAILHAAEDAVPRLVLLR